jgi:hypothetical protein
MVDRVKSIEGGNWLAKPVRIVKQADIKQDAYYFGKLSNTDFRNESNILTPEIIADQLTLNEGFEILEGENLVNDQIGIRFSGTGARYPCESRIFNLPTGNYLFGMLVKPEDNSGAGVYFHSMSGNYVRAQNVFTNSNASPITSNNETISVHIRNGWYFLGAYMDVTLDTFCRIRPYYSNNPENQAFGYGGMFAFLNPDIDTRIPITKGYFDMNPQVDYFARGMHLPTNAVFIGDEITRY